MKAQWRVALRAPVQGKASVATARQRQRHRRQAMTDDPRWYVGIDWATEAHQVCLLDATGKILGEKSFEHGGEGMAELCAWLLALTGGQPAQIAVAIETSHG